MSVQVWKYPLAVGENEVRLTPGATVLAVLNQRETVTLWAEVSTIAVASERRRFGVFATGEALPPTRKYIGTVLTRNGDRVWHVYELPGLGTVSGGDSAPGTSATAPAAEAPSRS